jgi:hypothetical protein
MASIRQIIDQANEIVARAQNVSASGTALFSHETSAQEKRLSADLMRQSANLLRLKAATAIALRIISQNRGGQPTDAQIAEAFSAAGISEPERDPMLSEVRDLLGLG